MMSCDVMCCHVMMSCDVFIQALALHAARESMVLLQNNGMCYDSIIVLVSSNIQS